MPKLADRSWNVHVVLPPELVRDIELYADRQAVRPTVSAVIRAALVRFLELEGAR